MLTWLGARPHGPRSEDRLVRGVLVEVHEDPLAALLLHHFEVTRSGCCRSSSRARATAPARTSTRVPPRLQAGVDVDAAIAGGLRVCGDPELLEQEMRASGGLADGVETDPGLRVEVDAQLVGVLRLIDPEGPR